MRKLEKEVKILDINKAELELILNKINARKIEESLQRIYVYDLPSIYARFYDCLLQLKQVNKPYQFEICRNKLQGILTEVDNLTTKKDQENIEQITSTKSLVDLLNRTNNEDLLNIFSDRSIVDIVKQYEINPNKWVRVRQTKINFKQKDKLITNCSINLMQSGFSKRAWCDLPEDTYKSNGRVRHERLNIQIGPLMNIQVHSYQAYEIKDRDKMCNNNVGSVEHFDIYVFRNNELIGGKPFEMLDIATLSDKDKEYFIGYNEKARENCFINFLLNVDDSSDLLEHRTSIEITEKAYETISTNENLANFEIKL